MQQNFALIRFRILTSIGTFFYKFSLSIYSVSSLIILKNFHQNPNRTRMFCSNCTMGESEQTMPRVEGNLGHLHGYLFSIQKHNEFKSSVPYTKLLHHKRNTEAMNCGLTSAGWIGDFALMIGRVRILLHCSWCFRTDPRIPRVTTFPMYKIPSGFGARGSESSRRRKRAVSVLRHLHAGRPQAGWACSIHPTVACVIVRQLRRRPCLCVCVFGTVLILRRRCWYSQLVIGLLLPCRGARNCRRVVLCNTVKVMEPVCQLLLSQLINKTDLQCFRNKKRMSVSRTSKSINKQQRRRLKRWELIFDVIIHQNQKMKITRENSKNCIFVYLIYKYN